MLILLIVVLILLFGGGGATGVAPVVVGGKYGKGVLTASAVRPTGPGRGSRSSS
jgi:hypothetical protein